jgi:lipase chaperone LimK
VTRPHAVTRVELAVVLGEEERAQALRAELKDMPLTEEERAQCQRELDAADATLQLKE